MIYITGDTHGDFYRFTTDNFHDGKNLTKNDYMIITGDFGGIWDVNFSKSQEDYWLNWLNDRPWTTLFVDGNHENFNRLDKYSTSPMFGAEGGKIKDSIFHLKRGQIYTIEGLKFFSFGGGFSIDKIERKTDISWWEREMPSYKEYNDGLANLKLVDNKVDYIITHTCSMKAFYEMASKYDMTHKVIDGETVLRKYFNEVEYTIEYKKWYCGHFHIQDVFQKVEFLYKNIVKIV